MIKKEIREKREKEMEMILYLCLCRLQARWEKAVGESDSGTESGCRISVIELIEKEKTRENEKWNYVANR